MIDIQTIPELDAQGLRKFGLTIAIAVVVFFGIAIPWIFDVRFPIWPWIFGAIFVAWAVVAPGTMSTVYKLWMKFGLLLNRVVSPVVLGVVYFVLVTPLGIAMRIFGRRPMNDDINADSKSYRIVSPRRNPDHVEKPY